MRYISFNYSSLHRFRQAILVSYMVNVGFTRSPSFSYYEIAFSFCYNEQMQRKKRDYTVDAVVRALKILEALGRSSKELGVLELSKKVEIHVSTVYRLLSTLVSQGMVDQNPDSEKYRLGIKLFELAMTKMRGMEVRKVAFPYLTKLHNEIEETVFLGVCRGTEVLIIETVSESRGIIFQSQVGVGEPLYCTGIGKALLAHLSPKVQETLMKRLRLRRHTPNTITRRPDLRKHLSQVREQGYAIDDEEILMGVKCVAAPILDTSGYAAAALSVVGPSDRVDDRCQYIIERVLETREEISRQMGYVGEDSLAVTPSTLGLPPSDVATI